MAFLQLAHALHVVGETTGAPPPDFAAAGAGDMAFAPPVYSNWPYLDDLEAAHEGPPSGRPHRCVHGWAHGPVIIGGLSDSGTRGAKYVVEQMLNVTMQHEKVGPCGDDNVINWKIHTLMLNVSDVEQAAGELCEAVKKVWELAGRPAGAWGFKSPRSILMVRLWNYLFQDDYRFVHVVRDPLFNCAPGANQIQYKRWCQSVLSAEECVGNRGCLQYWSKVNGAAREAFSQPDRKSRYVYMSMDRLVLPEAVAGSSSYRMLKRELPKLSSLGAIAVDEPLIMRILAEEHQYAPRYQAHHPFLRDNLEQLSEERRSVGRVVAQLGYKIDGQGITEEYGEV